MRSWTLIVFALVLSGLVASALIFSKGLSKPIPPQEIARAVASPASSPSPATKNSPLPTFQGLPTAQIQPSTPEASPSAQIDLSTDPNGLSKAIVTLKTTQGVIKFKFYPAEAPKTVHRLVELIQQGFYNNLSFHRVVPGFVIQGGDPAGNGTGGSGQKLPAEFNNRQHVEGTLAMARAQDPNSADSQFYIALGTLPHLDRNYTVFGQVIEGMDVVKKIKVGDRMTSVIVQ